MERKRDKDERGERNQEQGSEGKGPMPKQATRRGRIKEKKKSPKEKAGTKIRRTKPEGIKQ